MLDLEPWTSPITARTTDRFEMFRERRGELLLVGMSDHLGCRVSGCCWEEERGERRGGEWHQQQSLHSTPACHVSRRVMMDLSELELCHNTIRQWGPGTIFIPSAVRRVKWHHICYWLLRRRSGYCRMWGNHWWPGTTRAVFVQWERPILGNLICR